MSRVLADSAPEAVWRARPFAPAVGERLGALETVEDGGAKEYVFGVGLNRFRMFVVRKGQRVFGYLNICPHYSLPLNHRADEFLTRSGDRIMCRQHLALFAIEDGRGLEGACEGRGLDVIPVSVRAGEMIIG
jgi:nitrite reductase/ring-hydroxylating ferredoxin subunit